MEDLYAELGVSRDASSATIKSSYRRQAKKVHPDAGGSTYKFAKLERAKRILTDPVKRLTYDRTGRVDDGPVNDERVAAINLIGSLLDNLVSKLTDEQLDCVNLLETLRVQLRECEARGKHVAAENRKCSAKITKLAKRFKLRRSAKDDPVKRLMDGRANQFEQTANAADMEVSKIKLALEILDGYKFEDDVVKLAFKVGVF